MSRCLIYASCSSVLSLSRLSARDCSLHQPHAVLTFTEAAQRQRLTRPGLARTRHPALDWLSSGLCHLKSVDIGHPGTIYPVRKFFCSSPRWEQGPDLTALKWCLVFVIYIELAKCVAETRTGIVSEFPMQAKILKVISIRHTHTQNFMTTDQ